MLCLLTYPLFGGCKATGKAVSYTHLVSKDIFYDFFFLLLFFSVELLIILKCEHTQNIPSNTYDRVSECMRRIQEVRLSKYR